MEKVKLEKSTQFNFNSFYQIHYRRTFLFAKSYVHDAWAAEDIASEALTSLWEIMKKNEEVQLWLEADEKNRKEFRSLRTLYDITVGHLPDLDIYALPQKKGAKHLILEMLKIAAAILITFSCTYYFLMPAQKEKADMEQAIMQSLFVPAGQRAELMLADGTKVWLNGLTTFTFPNKFTETSREVFLDGEAYFDVHHDATKKFTVNTKMHDIHVLGTEFNVSAYCIMILKS